MNPEDAAFLATLRAEPLPADFEATGFDCGEPDLTEYLTDGTAASEELAAFSRCYVVLTDSDEFGFVANLGEQDRRIAVLKFFRRSRKGESPQQVSMRYDILLQGED